MRSNNVAARAGRWSAAHRKAAILGWIAFVILATLIGGGIGQTKLEQSESGNGESKRGEQIIAAADFPKHVTEQVLVQGKGALEAGDPEVTAAVKDVVGRLERLDGVSDVARPLAS